MREHKEILTGCTGVYTRTGLMFNHFSLSTGVKRR